MQRLVPLLAAIPMTLALASCTTGATAPASTPSAGPPSFPQVPGTVLSRTEPNPGDWIVEIRVADGADAYRDARARLTAAGYSITNDAPAGDGGDGQACTTRLCVSFSAATRPGGAPTLEYEVFHSTGVVG